MSLAFPVPLALGAAAALALGGAAVPAAAATPELRATIGGVNAAENLLQAADGRIYASSNGAVYHLLPPAAPAPLASAGWSRGDALKATYLDTHDHPCYDLGMTEQVSSHTVFVVCTENNLDINAPKHLMAIDPAQPGSTAEPTLREVGALPSTGLPNGLAADSWGHLYYADTGLLYPGSVHRITLSGTSTLVSDVATIQFLLENPNGIKAGGGSLYVGTDPVLLLGTTRILRYGLSASGTTLLPAFVTTEAGFYDDFTLAAGGQILAAEYLLGQVQQVDEASGAVVQRLGVAFPTSATIVTRGSDSAMLVTQRSANQVAVYTNGWGLKPR